MSPQPIAVFDHPETPIRVNNRVVPGRHHPSALLFFRIPGGSDVVLWTREDRKRLNLRRKVAPLLIRAREMALETPKLRAIPFEHHWNVRREKASRPHGNERGKWLLFHKFMDDGSASLLICPGNVHSRSSKNTLARTYHHRRNGQCPLNPATFVYNSLNPGQYQYNRINHTWQLQ